MTITYQGGTEQARQIVHHHALLRRGLERRVATVCDAVAGGVSCQRQVAILRDYLDEEILPHAEAEERSLCRAAATQRWQRAGPFAHPRAPRAGALRSWQHRHRGAARRPGSAPRVGDYGRRVMRTGDRRDGDAASFR